MARQRIELLKVPVDILPSEELEQEIINLLAEEGPKQIVLLSVWDLLKARRNTEFRAVIKSAGLVLPVSKSILKGAAFLKKTQPERYNPFTFVINILSILESHYKSAYLFGSRKKSLLTAEKNVRSTFPGLQIVGRCVGYFPKSVEKNIISAIQKASPSLVLFSSGIPGKQRWFYRNRRKFESGLFLWHPDVIDIFAERKNRVSEKTFRKGLEIWAEILRNPFRIFLVFPYIWYIILLVCTRLFKKNEHTAE